MPTHYSVAELAELIAAVNRIDLTLATPCDHAVARCRVREVTQISRKGTKKDPEKISKSLI
jgi:hypothetical protein